jgi:hypothetical protein
MYLATKFKKTSNRRLQKNLNVVIMYIPNNFHFKRQERIITKRENWIKCCNFQLFSPKYENMIRHC